MSLNLQERYFNADGTPTIAGMKAFSRLEELARKLDAVAALGGTPTVQDIVDAINNA